MANTICIFLVASLFVLSNAKPLDVGMVKGLISKESGKTRGAINAAIGMSVSSAMKSATTDAQRQCIAAAKDKAFEHVNMEINKTARGLQTMAESNAAQMSNVTFDQVNARLIAMFLQVKNSLISESMAEINKCNH